MWCSQVRYRPHILCLMAKCDLRRFELSYTGSFFCFQCSCFNAHFATTSATAIVAAHCVAAIITAATPYNTTAVIATAHFVAAIVAAVAHYVLLKSLLLLPTILLQLLLLLIMCPLWSLLLLIVIFLRTLLLLIMWRSFQTSSSYCCVCCLAL